MHLKAKKFADYVLGLEKELDLDEIHGQAFCTYSDIVSLTIKVLEGDVGERFIYALDRYLCRLLSVGDFVLFAKICPIMPKEAPIGQPYEFAKQYLSRFEDVAKILSPQTFDVVSGQIFERLLTNTQRRELVEIAISYFTKKSVRGGIASWYGKLILLEDVTIEELQKGVDVMLSLSMANEASILLRQILLRDPDNQNANKNTLLITLQKHINASSFESLCKEKETVISYLDALGKSKTTSINAILDVLKPVVAKVYISLGHFDLLDVVLDRLYSTSKSSYAKQCEEIANSYLHNGLFEVAKGYFLNALPHAAKSTHKIYFALLLIALKCKNEQELKESTEFNKGLEEYRTLLYAVREDEKLFKHYSDLADEIEKNQTVRRDAETLLMLMATQDELFKKTRARLKKKFQFALCFEWVLVALGFVLYFTVPFALGKHQLFVYIPLLSTIVTFAIYRFNVKTEYEKAYSAFPHKRADLSADSYTQMEKVVVPIVVSIICIIVALCRIGYLKFYADDTIVGFGKGYMYASQADGEEGIIIKDHGDRVSFLIPEVIKGQKVVDVKSSFHNYDKAEEVIIEVSSDIETDPNQYSSLFISDTIMKSLFIRKSVSKINADAIRYYSCIYFEGSEEEWDTIIEGSDEAISACKKKLYTKKTNSTNHSWHYNLRGVPTKNN